MTDPQPPAAMDEPWHAMDSEAIFDHLDSDPDGLDKAAATERLEVYGENEIEADEGVTPLSILIEQFRTALIWVLIVAAIVMGAVGHWLDAGVIAGVVVFIAVFGFFQDYRAEQAIQALRKMSTTHAIAIRDGERVEIDAKRVVPGDVIYVESGDIVPADARLIEESNLRANESALTGESVGVSKKTGELEQERALAERTNMIYRDTAITRGTGRAVVVGTGGDTEMGAIAEQLVEAEDRETPFQTEMDRLGKIIAGGVIGAVTVIAISELVIGDTPPLEVFLTAVGIAVSAVPEGLPAVVTLSLALGARRLADKNALVRRLPIVEALGSVDVICTDKTGTLTEEEMTTTRIYANGETITVTGTGFEPEGEFKQDGEPVDPTTFEELLRCGMCCNDVEIGRREVEGEDEERTYLGDPTEIAIFVAAQKAGVEPEHLIGAYPRVGTVDFTSNRKRMTTVHETTADHDIASGDHIAYTKGAPEEILDRSSRELIDGEIREMTADRRKEIADVVETYADEALRVMGFAMKPDAPATADEAIETDLVFLGLQGMLDPPRPEVPDAIAACKQAGIDIEMITGDNPRTARAIAAEVGIESPTVVTGPEIDAMDDEELAKTIEDIDIFARTSPEHKSRILKTLQSVGHTVAMTGDGVNDAPAVKNADVGVAMGIRGTDVTEQASDIVLLDDNFATIRDAVHGGRRIFDNVRKFVNYLLSGNGGEVTMIFTGTMAGLGLVITPIQIIWINVVTDGIPALAMGVDPAADDIMERGPRPREEGVITERIVTSIVGIAIFMTVCLLPLFTVNHTGQLVPWLDIGDIDLGYEPGRELAQTMVFTGFVVMEIVRIQAIRYRYNLGLFTNRWLVLAVGVAVVLQLLVLYTGVGQLLFGVEPLALVHWVQIGVAGAVFALLMAVFVWVQDQFFDRY